MKHEYLYDMDSIPVYCYETAFKLFDLDDNTVAYYQTIDPSGTMLERHLAMGYRHPAIRSVKNGYYQLAECYPTLFLCWLMHKFITLPVAQYPLESYVNLQARASISSQLVHLYESEQIDDVLFQDIISTLQAVPFVEDKTDATIRLQSPLISLSDIQFLLERVRTATNRLNAKEVALAISQYRISESKHRASQLLYLYWNQSSTGDYRDSPKAHIRKEVNRRIKQISALDLLDPFGMDGSKFLLEASVGSLASGVTVDREKATAASNALAALASLFPVKEKS